MAQVYVGIGSNQNREFYIRNALDSLHEKFMSLRLSTVYETEAVGFVGDPFYNLVAGFETNLSVAQLSAFLKALEDQNDRCRNEPKFSGRTLDIDLLTYGERVGQFAGVELPRGEITKNAYVLRPLAELAGAELHPHLGISYGDLWQAYHKGSQKLWPVAFSWRGRALPAAIF